MRELPTQPEGAKRLWWAALVLVTITLVAANYDLVAGRVAGIWDANLFYFPYFSLVADYARSGRFLLWNPLSNAGIPDYAEPQVGAFSPVLVAIAGVTGGSGAGFRFYWLAIWWLAGAGILVLARHLGASAWGGCLAAIGFMFSGFFTAQAEHTSMLYAVALLPWIVWRLDVALSRGAFRPAFEAGVLWGMSGLGGYPGLMTSNGCYVALWAVGRWCCSKATPAVEDSEASVTLDQKGPSLGFALLALGLVLLVGVIVLSPTYGPLLYEGAGYSDRIGPLPRGVAVDSNALPLGAMATFASPYLAALKLKSPDLWPAADISVCSIYISPVVAALALLSLVTRRRDAWRWWIAALGCLWLACALGSALPVRGWFYDLLPPTRYFRHSGNLRAYWLFSVAILAALASRDLSRAIRFPQKRIWRLFLGVAMLLSALALLSYWIVIHGTGHLAPPRALADLHWAGIWGGLCAIAWIAFLQHRRPGRWLLPSLLLALTSADAFLTITLARPMMYSFITSGYWREIDRRRNPALDLTSIHGMQRVLRSPLGFPGGPNNLNLPLKISVLEGHIPFGNRFHRDLLTRPALRAMALGSSRIWFSPRATEAAATEACYNALVRRAEALGTAPILIHPRDSLVDGLGGRSSGAECSDQESVIFGLPPARPIEVDLTAYTPERLEFSVFCSEEGYLLVTDRWSRCWGAEVNGSPAEVLPANLIFRALRLKAGVNWVQFTHHPFGYPALLIASWVVVALALAGALYDGWFRRIRRPARSWPGGSKKKTA